MTHSARSFVEKLCSNVKLERDKSIQELSQMQLTLEEIRIYEDSFAAVVQNEESSWESKQSCLIALKIIVDVISHETCEKLKFRCQSLLHDDEVRVRLAVGDLLGAFCKRFGTEVYDYFSDSLLCYINENIERTILNETESKEADKLMEKIVGCHMHNSVEVDKVNVARIFHDTAGWHHLETNVKTLHNMVDGCGLEFSKYVDGTLMDLIFKILNHTNRFVRETGFYICASILTCFMPTVESGAPVASCSDPRNPELALGDRLANYFAAGLMDNWSQVRLAACVSTRRFLLNVVDLERREKYFSVLIPPLCLNRYHLAEGVRLYAQQTWSMVVGENGPSLVAKYIENVVHCYTEQTKSSNYTIRIASCQCIAELAQKINKDAVRPYVISLLQILINCLNDHTWQIRDTALLACEKFVGGFPEECRVVVTETLLDLYFLNLSDCVPAVCSGAAESLAKIIDTYGVEMFAGVVSKIKQGLKKVDEEPTSTGKCSEIDKHPVQIGTVGRLVYTKIDVQLNEQTCTCETNVKMSHEERPPIRREPFCWEITDGYVQLVAELTATKFPTIQPKIATDFLPLISSAAQKRHFVQHVHLLETICRRLPQIAKNLKKYFKPFLDDFIEPLFYSLTCECILTENSASTCLEDLVKIFGANILKAKIEKINPKFLPLYQKELDKFVV